MSTAGEDEGSNQRSKALITPQRPSDPINKYFSIVGHSGVLEVARCTFCRYERTRVPQQLKAHLAERCPHAPPEVKELFNTPEVRYVRGPYRKTREKMAGYLPRRTSIPYEKNQREKRKRYPDEDDENEDEDDYDEDDIQELEYRGQFVLQRPARQESEREASNHKRIREESDHRKHLTKEEMEQREHHAKIALMKREASFLETKDRIYNLVGNNLSTFLSTADSFLKHIMNHGWQSVSFGGLVNNSQNESADNH